MKSGSFLIPASLIVLSVTTLIVAGCSKSSNGKPKLSLASINTTVQLNDSLVATFKFSGASVSGGYFVSIRTRLNQQPPEDPTLDTLSSAIPTYSANVQMGLQEHSQFFRNHKTLPPCVRFQDANTIEGGRRPKSLQLESGEKGCR